MMKSAHFACLTPLLLGLVSATSSGAGDSETLEISKDGPDGDRWMYPFNATPGTRQAASTFGYWSSLDDAFDNRDGQMVITFDTDGDLAPGSASAWRVVSAKVTVQLSNEGIRLDTTPDDWRNFVEAGNEDFIPDADPGQPIELFGTGYRGGYDAASWFETAPFGQGDTTLPGARFAHALGWRDGSFVDVSNHVREGWNPVPFAVGVVDGLPDGQVIPIDSVFEFELDVQSPGVEAYVLEGLDVGTVAFTITSMTEVEVMGGTFPLFYCRENIAVDFGIASAATLDIVLEPAPAGNPCDLTGDGLVDGADLTMLLGRWGTADSEADLDGSGQVDGADLAELLGCWD